MCNDLFMVRMALLRENGIRTHVNNDEAQKLTTSKKRCLHPTAFYCSIQESKYKRSKPHKFQRGVAVTAQASAMRVGTRHDHVGSIVVLWMPGLAIHKEEHCMMLL